jgi:uncharacterized protein with PQ loop repeat
MQIDPLTLVVVAANVTGGLMALPQAAKLATSRRVHGVSPTWAACSVAVNAWWVAYGFGVRDLGIAPVSAVSVIAYLSIAVNLVRFGGGRGAALTMAIRGTAIGAIPLIALALGGWPAAGVSLGLLYGVQLSPAVVAVYRAVDVSGVSVATWAIALSEAFLWGVYGIARRDIGLIGLAVTGTSMSVLVLSRLYLRRPRRGFQPLGLAPA